MITFVIESQAPMLSGPLSPLADNVGLMELGEKIRRARETKGLSQVALGKSIGVSQVAIKKIESGETRKSKYLHEILRFLDLTDPQEQQEPTQTRRFFSKDANMPVYASAEGGHGAIIVSTDAIEYVLRPHTLENISDAYAILITGDSMDPAFEPGDTAWVNPRLPYIRGCDVILYSDEDEKRATIKRLVTWTDAEWTLKQYNPPKTFKLSRSEWRLCHRVVGKFSRR